MRRADDAVHPARNDGEALRPGWLAQPSSALSCLAYVGGGLGLRRYLRWRDGTTSPDADLYCALMVANGLGGLAFHGPGDRSARWLHDVALLGTLTATAAANGQRAAPVTAASTVAAGVALVAMPDCTNAVSAALGAVAALTQADAARRRVRDGNTIAGLTRSAVLFAAAAAVNLASRSGARAHRPDSRWQGHAAWHVMTAAAMAQWGAATFKTINRFGSETA